MADTLQLPATLDALGPIRAFVDAAASAAGLDHKASYRLRLAVDEIATNVITHGYEEAGLRGDLELQAWRNGETLTIILEDDAVPFDPTTLAEPDDLGTPLEERAVGGLGVFLTVHGVDEFRYERVARRNRNIFVMHRQGADDG